MAKKHHHYVYVIELSKAVLYERNFVKCNPDYDPSKPCVYVGMTGLDPDARFDKHKAGVRANRYAQKYGERLMPELYECYNPMLRVPNIMSDALSRFSLRARRKARSLVILSKGLSTTPWAKTRASPEGCSQNRR